MTTLTYRPDDTVYSIPTCNVTDACMLLDRHALKLSMTQEKMCRFDGKQCNKQCCDKCNIDDILSLRYKRLQVEDSALQMRHVAALIGNFPTSKTSKTSKYKVGDTPVCYYFWVKALGVSKNKYTEIKKNYDNNSNIIRTDARTGGKQVTLLSLMCIAFWRVYFADFCQTPDNVIFLWPTGETHQTIYKSNFTDFCKTGFPNQPVPSMSTFVKARHDKEFGKVKQRAKHFHNKCTLCSVLGEQRRKGFQTIEQDRANLKLRNDHLREVALWHSAETALTYRARHSPDQIQVFKIDDTNALELPKTRERESKAMAGMYKVKLVPCLLEDVNNNEKSYIYHMKGAYKKGGNRFCTALYHAMMAAKRSERPSSKARICYIIGDNYSENRNKLNLRFASEVVNKCAGSMMK